MCVCGNMISGMCYTHICVYQKKEQGIGQWLDDLSIQKWHCGSHQMMPVRLLDLFRLLFSTTMWHIVCALLLL